MTMSTLIENLNTIYKAKKDIKTALTNKGQSVGDNILDYAGAINSISGGGSPVYRNWWKVYFIDYDGTILSYQEVNDGDDFVFPDAPNHTDKELVFTGWNETSNHTSDYDPYDIYTIVIGAIYDTVGNTKLKLNAHSITMTTGFTLTSTVADGITIDWGDGTTTTSSSTDSTEYTHTYDRSYLGKDVTVEIQCADGNTYTFDSVKTGLDNIEPNNVKFGTGCTSIGNNAFYQCYGLKSITIPSSVTYIDSDSLSYCYSLQSVSIPSSVKNISNYAFIDSKPSIYNKYRVNTYNPNSIYNIFKIESNKGFGAFVCSITIPSGVTSIGNSAFKDCYSLQSITIPSSVTRINDLAFSNCCSLQSITIPSGVTSIAAQAFEYCFNLQSVNIPSSVTHIDGNTFSNCYSLQSITIPSSVTGISGSAFYSCYSLQSITIPSGVTYIESGTLMGCHSLKSVSIPLSVTDINTQAFQQCYSMQSLSIPSSVANICWGAFIETNCILNFGNDRTTVPTIESTDSLGSNFCVVPDALYDTWCAETNWSAITDRIIKYSDYHGVTA